MQPTMFRTLLIGFLLVFLEQTSSFTIKPRLECTGVPADIVFVLDSSSSIWGPHFQKQLDFVSYMVNQLDIGMGPEQVRVGVELFSNSAHVKINLDESVGKETLNQKIDQISRLYGDTNTADALNQLKDTMFKPERGSRSGVNHIALILTDGASTDKAATQVAAKACRDANIQLFAIGIGHSVSLTELMGIASKPIEKFLFRAPSYETLDRIKDQVAKQTCHAVVIPPPTTTTKKPTTTTEPTTTTSKPTTTTTKPTTTTTEPTTTKPTTTTTKPTTTTTKSTTTTTKSTTTTTEPTTTTTEPTTTTMEATTTTTIPKTTTTKPTTTTTKPTTTTTKSTTTTTKSTTTTTEPTTTTKEPTTTTKEPTTTTSKPTATSTESVPTTTTTESTTLMPPTDELIPGDQAERACKNRRADVFFLLDSSSSIPIDEFKKQINVIEDIVNKFDIGFAKTRVGVSVFSHKYNSILDFDSGANKEDTLKKIQNIKFMGGGTQTGKALHHVRSHVFNPASIRPGAERILIVFTDGQSIDYERTSAEAKLLQESGVKVFVVGIGPDVDQDELLDIASRPSTDFLHTFDTFDLLLAKSGLLTYKACTVNDQTFEKDQLACNAAQPTDVVFMVNNNRFGQETTNHILRASAELIKVVGSKGTFRYGTIFDDCHPTMDMAIGSIADKSRLISEIVNFKYSSLSSLLGKLQHNIFPSGSWNKRKVGLLFLDKTIDLNDPQILAQARRAHFENIQLYVVIIGEGVDMRRVQSVLAPKEQIINVYSYETLSSYLPIMFVKRFCIPRKTPLDTKPSLA